MRKEYLHIKKGFSLVEILVAISVFLVFVLATTGVTSTISKDIRHVANSERANILAEEAIEASRNIRDSGTGFIYLPDGTYGLSTSTSEWSLSGTSDTQGIFTRTVTVSSINGSEKKVRARVSWPDQISESNSVSMDTYLTDWRAPLNIGLTINKTVINHGGTSVASDFLPVNLSTLAWDNSVDPPVQNIVSIPIVFSPSTMTLGPGVYTFLTSNNPSYSLSLSSDCSGNSITLSNGDAKLCDITYEEYYVPTVSSPTVSAISSTTATLGANVTSLGNPASISARGTCWGTTPAPITNCLAEGGTTTGIFTHPRTGFTASTTYYYRGYATNNTGTGYSTDGTFITSSSNVVPTVDTPVSSAVTSSSATLGATVRSLGVPATISARGICYGTSIDPSLVNGATCVDAVLSQTVPEAFTVSATSLASGTLYNYRGYATNSGGTGYTANATFTTTVPSSTITFVGAATSTGTTAVIPTHQVGDLLIAFAYRDGNAAPPTVPAGWTTISSTGGGNANSSVLAYRIATGADVGIGWSNATEIIVHVYRGQSISSPIGDNKSQTGNGTTVTYPALVMNVTNGTSWVIGFAGHRSTNTNLQIPPAGMILRVNFVDPTDEVSSHDTNGGVTSWSATNVSVGGTGRGWMTRTLEIKSN